MITPSINDLDDIVHIKGLFYLNDYEIIRDSLGRAI